MATTAADVAKTSFDSPRDVSIVIAARALSLFGDTSALVALTLLFHDEGRGTLAVAALLLCGLAPSVLLSRWVGRLADGHRARALLIASSVVQLGLCLLLIGSGSSMFTFVLMLLLGCGEAVNAAMWQVLLPRVAGRSSITRAVGLSQAASTGGSILAPALGAILFQFLGVRGALAIDAATFAAITVAALTVRRSAFVAERPNDGAVQRGAAHPDHRVSGLRLVLGDRIMRFSASMLALGLVVGAAVNVVEVYLVRDVIGASAGWYGVLGALWGAGLFLGSLLVGRTVEIDRMPRASVVGALVMFAALFAYAVAPTIAVLAPLAVLGGIGNGVLVVSNNASVMARSPDDARGRIGAAINSLNSTALIVAMIAGGVIATVVDVRSIFVLAGAVGIAATLVLTGVLRATATHHDDANGPA